MSRLRPATVRFYFDADVLGLAHAVARLRPDITYPSDPGGDLHGRRRPPCPITATRTPDDEWIPLVADQDWLIVTRDGAIQRRRAELGAVRSSGARMVALSPQDAVGTWAQLEVLLCQWQAIERLLELRGPFIYRATRTALTRVDLT